MNSDTAPHHEAIADRRTTWLIPLGLIVAGVLVYLNTLSNPFVFDDTPWIVNRERIHSLSNLGEMLMATNRPLLEITLALNYAVGGLEPLPYRLTNMLIHILTGLTLFGLAHRTLNLPTMSESIRAKSAWLAGAVALIWVVHPLNTQSVTYLIQRGESMMGLFYLLTLYSFVRFATGGGKHWAVATVLACWLGAGCKEVIATVPLVVLIYDLCFIAKSWREPIVKRWGVYLGLFAMWLPLSFMLVRGLGGEDVSAGLGLESNMLSRWTYLLSQPGVIVQVYLRKAIWPYPLVLDYGWPPAIPEDTPPDARTGLFLSNVLFQGLIVTGLFAVSVLGVMKRTWWGFLGAAFFLILAPTSSLMPIADLAVEHRMYLPLIVVVVLGVLGVYGLLDKTMHGQTGTFGLLILAVAALAFGVQTFIRNYDYQSRIAIWDKVVIARPYNPRGWHNLGKALEDAERYDEAMLCYDNVLRIRPEHAPATFNKGVLLFKAGQIDASYPLFEKVIELEPDDDTAHEYLGLLSLARKDIDGAVTAFRRAVEASPQTPKHRQNLAAALRDAGEVDEAVQVLREAVEYAEQAGWPDEVVRNFKDRLIRYRVEDEPAPDGP